MQVQVAPTHRAPAAWLPLLLVAIVLMVASFAGGVAYEHDGPDRAPAVTTVQRDAPEVTQVTAVRHPSEREIVVLKS